MDVDDIITEMLVAFSQRQTTPFIIRRKNVDNLSQWSHYEP